MWKWILGVAAVLGLTCVGGGFWAYSSGKLKPLMEQFNPESKSTPVRLEPVTRGKLDKTVSAPGQIEPRTKSQISAQVSARIIAIPLRENQLVKKNDVVVRLDATEYQALLDGAKANVKSEQARLESVRASLANSIVELGRKRELFSTKDISKADLDASELEYARAEANLKGAESAVDLANANVRRAEKDLSNCIISAPFDGVITKRNAEVGELVLVGTLNNASSVIMEIADLTDMLVKTRVDEANIAPVKAGQKAKVFLNPFPGKTFTALVERVSLLRMIDKDGTTYFETELKLENPENAELRSGFTANADIAVETMHDVLLVPSQAVVDRNTDDLPKDVREGNQFLDKAKKVNRVVYTLVDGKAKAHPVSIGASDLTRTIILGGLEENEKVVAGPYKVLQNLKDGQRLADESTLPPPVEKGKKIEDAKPKQTAQSDSTKSKGPS